MKNIHVLSTTKDFEVWKDVVGYEGLYQVSNFGNIKSDICNKNSMLYY